MGPLPQPVTLLFQPAEEGGGGGAKMVADGCLTGERIGAPVTKVFGLHGWPGLPLGTLATRSGPLMAAQARFEITVRGTGCHAAWPHVGRDPVVAGSAIVMALQHIVSRNVDPLAAAVLSVTQFHAGTAINVIADHAVLKGTTRWLDARAGQTCKDRLHEVATMVGRAHGCEVEVSYRPGYPVTENHPDAVAYLEKHARPMLGDEGLVLDVPPVMGAEDFSYYCAEVPSCFAFLGLNTAERPSAQLHQPDFDFNDDALSLGVELLCRLALGDA